MINLINRYWRITLFITVIVTSYACFLFTDNLKSGVPAMYVEALYYSVSLFVFGGIDIGHPYGATKMIHLLLWMCYFVAPLLTVSFVYQIVQDRILNRLKMKWSGHIVICGFGRNGKLIYQLLRHQWARTQKIIVIENDQSNPYTELLTHDRRTWWLRSDFTKQIVLKNARVDKAKSVYITTNHDMNNINAMFEIQEMADRNKNLNLFCHVGDIDLQKNMMETLSEERKYRNVKLFNGYRAVTKFLYEEMIQKSSVLSENGNIFIIMGFGRFGEMIFTHIMNDCHRGKQDSIYIVTLNQNNLLKRHKYKWSREKFVADCKVNDPIIGDMTNPEIWNNLAKKINQTKKRIIIFTCQDNDISNLNTAISLKLEGPEQFTHAVIYCRMYSETAHALNKILERRITKQIEKDVILFPMREKLRNAFELELFHIRRESDAKGLNSG
ncbi:NAD-binding protein [candidate division KSB1 bacterium]|nr:NAD-binding protein [candidate division KSB1 bacterium]